MAEWGRGRGGEGEIGEVRMTPLLATGMTSLDGAVIAVYAVGMLAVGAFYARRTRNTEDYLLGGRTMRASSVGLSLFATLLSTITYLALPGEMINKGPVILWSMLAIPIAYVVVGYFLIPHFMRLRVTSAYEILERRLGLEIRLIASIIFLLTRLFWMALIIYITADKVIVVMMRWPASATPYVAAALGLVTVVYTSMGGLRAVVFTDVIQSFILLGGGVASIVLITVRMGGVAEWWPDQWSPNWDAQPVFSSDPTVRVTVVGSIVYMTVWWICTAGSDQMAIQRYLATRDERAARRVFLITGVSNVVVTLCLASLGFALLGYYRAHPDELAPGMSIEAAADKLFPHYIVHALPPGVTGLVISGLLAAAMSSLSSGINSACSVVSEDFVERIRDRPAGAFEVVVDSPASHPVPRMAPSVIHPSPAAAAQRDRLRMRQTRLIAALTGLLVVALSTFMGRVPGNIMEVTVRTNHVFVAPLFGLFFMALFVPFATRFGTVVGALTGCTVAVVIAYWDMLTGGPTLSFQWISLFSLAANLAVGCTVSLLSGGRKP